MLIDTIKMLVLIMNLARPQDKRLS
jgi:hypothetical protein